MEGRAKRVKRRSTHARSNAFLWSRTGLIATSWHLPPSANHFVTQLLAAARGVASGTCQTVGHEPARAETASERRKDRWFWHRGEGGGPRRVATIASQGTTILGVADALIYGVDLATRPACPPRYVRLLDVEPALMGLSLVLAAAGAGLAALLFGRRRLIDRLGRAGI